MEYIIKNRQPANLFRFFEEISAIPRGSRNEEAIADYLVRFAEARGLFCYRDEMHNILMRMPGSAGREQEAPILFQGHTDMVCEKNADTVHDFARDPLKLALTEDGRLYARGTTLGGDDGAAVAIMLALLDGELDSHPPIECLFTTQEEIGLHGAAAFDCGQITARRMINLDAESDDTVIVGCAGGVRSDLTLPLTRVKFAGEALEITVKGLIGGHSGENIGLWRANANVLMGRLLGALTFDHALRLCHIEGGSKDNAIPRECRALVSVTLASQAAERVLALAEAIRGELCEEDSGFVVTAVPAEAPAVMADAESTARALRALAVLPNGVLAMSRKVPGLVEFSRNLGVVRTQETEVHLIFSSRSAIESQLDCSAAQLEALAAMGGGQVRHHSRYPGWDYARFSPLRDAYLAAYGKVCGEAPHVEAIHAGLECGLLREKLPDLDMIAIGPNMENIHSPAERLDLASCEKLWRIIAELLR